MALAMLSGGEGVDSVPSLNLEGFGNLQSEERGAWVG